MCRTNGQPTHALETDLIPKNAKFSYTLSFGAQDWGDHSRISGKTLRILKLKFLRS